MEPGIERSIDIEKLTDRRRKGVIKAAVKFIYLLLSTKVAR